MKELQAANTDNNLPGWGSWAGAGIKGESKKNHKKTATKKSKTLSRKDQIKNVVITDKIPKKLREHMVNEVPFPFKTIKDYEASIRAPIGNTFVPETAFRRNIKPAVETRMGSIITPVTVADLVTKPKKKKGK